MSVDAKSVENKRMQKLELTWVGKDEPIAVVIACSSFDSAAAKAFPNIKVKKIPQMLLKRCEFDKTDYALNIVAAPAEEEEDG